MFDSSFYSAVRDYHPERQIGKEAMKTTLLREFGGPEVLRYGQFQSQARAVEVVRLY
jgi:hypothetical protein